MPIREYKCKNKNCKNNKGFEEIHFLLREPRLTKCPLCGSNLEELISRSSFHLKGSGYYYTDYVKNKKPDKEKFKETVKDKKTNADKKNKSD